MEYDYIIVQSVLKKKRKLFVLSTLKFNKGEKNYSHKYNS